MANAKRTLRAVKRLLLCASAAAILVLAFLLWPKLVQWTSPKYKGKTAEEWLPSFSRTIDYEVVNAFGTNAVERVARVLVQKETVHQKAWQKLPAVARSALKRFQPPDLRNSRTAASIWLHALGSDARSALPILTNYVAKEGLFVHTLAYIAPEDPHVLQSAANLLTSPVGSSRVSASSSLRIFGEHGAALIPSLTNLLANPKFELPYNVLVGLGAIGPAAQTAVPFVRPYLTNTNTQQNALFAIEGIGSAASDAIPELCFLLTNTQGRTQVQVAHCLFLLGTEAREALPLVKSLKTQETNILQLLIWCTLGQLENDLPSAIEKIEQVATSPPGAFTSEGLFVPYANDRTPMGNLYNRGATSTALFLAGNDPFKSERLLSAVEARLHDQNPEVSAFARRAYWRITRDAAKSAPLLIEVLSARKDYQAHIGLECLREMQLAKADLPGLLEFFNNHQNRWKDRKQVLELITRIDPTSASGLRMSRL